MIKRFCDRCGKEIVGEPWYMKWSQNSSCGLSGASLFSDICSHADAAKTYSNAITLSAGPMYCGECRAAIIAFAAEKPEQEEVEFGVSDAEAIDALELVDRYCSGKECEKCVFLGELDECTIFDGDKYTLDEIVRLAREKLRKAHGGKK
jgi:hypothetical protein